MSKDNKGFTVEDTTVSHKLLNQSLNNSGEVNWTCNKDEGHPTLNDPYFENIYTAEKQYILGWIFSNGCIFDYLNIEYTGFSIKVQERDKYILEYIKELLSAKVPIKIEVIRGRNYAELIVASKRIYNDLLKYGLKPRKTHDLKYPLEHTRNHRAFILGYFDSGGTITISEKNKIPTFEITGTEIMVATIRDILSERLSLPNVSLIQKGNFYSISYSGTLVTNKIGEWLYSWNPPICLIRNRRIFHELVRTTKHEKSVVLSKYSPSGKQDVFNKRNIY